MCVDLVLSIFSKLVLPYCNLLGSINAPSLFMMQASGHMLDGWQTTEVNNYSFFYIKYLLESCLGYAITFGMI